MTNSPNIEENVKKTYTHPKTGKFTKNNPGGGRPKGSLSFTTLYKKAIAKIAESKGVSPEEFEVELVEKAIIKGFNGDRSFYADTMDRVHGKAPQSIDHTSGGEKITFGWYDTHNDTVSTEELGDTISSDEK
jgi:hypothetical protein